MCDECVQKDPFDEDLDPRDKPRPKPDPFDPLIDPEPKEPRKHPEWTDPVRPD